MTAEEFYELNRGKYFMYNGEKVRVVGCDFPHVIISTKKCGWKFSTRVDVDTSLLHDGDAGKFVYIEDLIPIEPQELNLCEILKGCEGVELWSDIFGECKLISVNNANSYKILVSVSYKDGKGTDYQTFTKYGKFYDCYQNCKCMLWPSETNRDWSTFKKNVKDDDWFACTDGNGVYTVIQYGNISENWEYIIPYDKFRLDLTEEDLKKLSIV